VIPLPIDPLLPEVVASLARGRNLVLTAEPGAGKTTRVPPALLGGLKAEEGIVVVEPRRLAARLSAVRVAEERGPELGSQLGGVVGYQVRFDERSSAATRLLYVTEGILLRRLLSSSGPPGGAGGPAGRVPAEESPLPPAVPRIVVLDEFHERSLQSDLLLAFLRQLQLGSRPDLSLVIMSATLEAEPAAAFLGDCPSMHAPGRLFPIEIIHAPTFDPAPLEEQVATAVRRALSEDDGDILVFLPGMAEIRRCATRIGSPPDVAVLPLHGTLPPEEQDRAVRPNSRRKVILSTNVAETSLTIDGVTVVIDSGLARIAGHSSWSGLPTLKVQKISRASAAQRAGRAGRTQPGRVFRLYTKVDHDARPSHETPEVRRADLCEPVLLLRAFGVREPLSFGWFEAPPREAIEAADELLARLGAVAGNELTPLGQRLATLPLHPRLGRVLLEAERRGAGRTGAELVALLQERDLATPGESETGDSDPLWALEQLQRGQGDRGVVQTVRRSAGQLTRLLATPPPSALTPPPFTGEAGRGVSSSPLQISLLTGYPDRVARRRRPGSDELLLSGGGTARLSRQSVVKEASLMVAIEAEEQRRAGESAIGVIRSASAIEPEWLLDLFPERLRDEQRVRFIADAERVDVDSLLFYDDLVLEESRGTAADSDAVSTALAEAALERGPSAYLPHDAPETEPARTLARLRFAREALPELELPEVGMDDVARTVRSLAAGKRRFDDLREGNLLEVLLSALDHKQRAAFEAAAPDSIALPSGRRVRLEYEDGKPPWIESRLQDFFGWTEGPRLAKGRVPVTLHLLAPNKRAVQVTGDLKGFWERHYPAVRKELMRRYPRHAWPDNPRVVPPPKPRR